MNILKTGKIRTEGSSESLGIRRNDYISAIRSDISDVKTNLANYQELKRQSLELIQYCKDNKLRGCLRVAKLELKLLDKKNRFELKRKKDLEKLLYKAEKYVSGSERQ